MPSAKPRVRLRHLLALVAVLGLLAVGCGNSSSSSSSTSSTAAAAGSAAITGVPGVTDTAIKFSAIGTNSNNPLGTCVLDCFTQGIKSYFDWRNSEGGIDGRNLELTTVLDDELSKNQEKALEVISANDTFGNFNAAQVGSGWGDLASAGIPTYVWAINPAQATGHPEIFGQREVNCIECTSRPVAFVAKEAGAKKIATIGYGVSENSKQCAQANAATIEKYSSDIGGAEVAYVNPNLAFGLPNGIGPEVTAMKDAGVDLVLACIDLNGMKTLAQEIDRQGLNDQITLYHTNTYDQAFVAAAGGLFDGDLILAQFRPFEADAGDSQLAQYKEWMDKNGYAQTEIAMVGWINADLAYQGIKAAGADFDRQKVIDATNQFTDYTAGGLTQPVDWTRQHVAPTEDDLATHGPAQDCIALVKVDNGKLVMVGDPAKPWYCWPGDTRAWSEPTPTNF